MKIIVTLGEILHAPLLGSWEIFCDKKGWGYWCINEGLAESSEEVTISLEDAQEYGLVQRKK